jgi:hypothetical protein
VVKRIKEYADAWGGGEFPLTCGITKHGFIEWLFPYGDDWRMHLEVTLRQMTPSSIMETFCERDCDKEFHEEALRRNRCNAKQVLTDIVTNEKQR